MSEPVNYALHRTIVAIDLHGDAVRRSEGLYLRRAVFHLVEDSFLEVGLPWSGLDADDAGDGLLVLIPADVPKAVVAERMPAALARLLDRHNAGHRESTRLGLRMALHAGDVHYDGRGKSGSAMLLAYRLLDSAAVRTAAKTTPHRLSLIVSDLFFEEVIRGTDQAGAFQRVRVEVKETSTVAWIRTGQPHAVEADRTDFAVLYDSADAEWAEWIAFQLRQAGYSAVLDARALRPSRDGFAPALDPVDHVVVVVSQNLSYEEVRAAQRLPATVTAVQVAAGASTALFRHTCDLVGLDSRTARHRILAALHIAGGREEEPGYPGGPGPTTLPVVRDEARAPELVVVCAEPD